MASTPERPRRWANVRRDTVIWLMGIGFSVNEMVIEPQPRAQALAFCVLLLGLPSVLNVNDLLKRMATATEPKGEGE